MSHLLFEPTSLGGIALSNRIVMAPMTRSRATAEHVPTEPMARYYAARATAGLIITEGTSPSPSGSGYARIPELSRAEQGDRWRAVTRAVHDAGGRIFLQIMHCGRVAHPANMENGTSVVAPSAVALPGAIYTDTLGMQPHPTPRALSTAEVGHVVGEYVSCVVRAIEDAGFDGVELHGANGYLIEQFLRPTTNLRRDIYGGSKEARFRFLREIFERAAQRVGPGRIGVRLSPFGTFNETPHYPEMESDYLYFARELGKLNPAYLHLLDHSSMGAPAVPASTRLALRDAFRGTTIWCGGFNRESAEEALRSGMADLVALGRPFLGNPDLPRRLREGLPLVEANQELLYGGGEKGYNDYPPYGYRS